LALLVSPGPKLEEADEERSRRRIERQTSEKKRLTPLRTLASMHEQVSLRTVSDLSVES
jgi:hypothetical protein